MDLAVEWSPPGSWTRITVIDAHTGGEPLRVFTGGIPELAPGGSLVVESIVGSRFTVRLAGSTTFGPYRAVVPEVEGSAHITGRSELLIDPEDPLAYGFLL